MLSDIMLSEITLNVIMLSAIMLNVVMLSVAMVSVVVPQRSQRSSATFAVLVLLVVANFASVNKTLTREY
jgi:hypothetical protein